MNPQSVAILAGIAIAFAFAVYFSFKNKNKCCGDCAECRRNCHRDKKQ